MIFSTFAKLKMDLSEGGGNEMPWRFAPNEFNQRLSQPPLKPVWPVIKTRRSCQKFLLITILAMVLCHLPKALQEAFYLAKYPCIAKNPHDGML